MNALRGFFLIDRPNGVPSPSIVLEKYLFDILHQQMCSSLAEREFFPLRLLWFFMLMRLVFLAEQTTKDQLISLGNKPQDPLGFDHSIDG